MITEIIKTNTNRPSIKIINKTAKIIKRGGLVVLPTDTVYGLVCDATNPKAVAKVYCVKKSPLTQPLSIAVNYFSYIYKYVENVPKPAKMLAKKFLPGPLTLVLSKSKTIPDIVTAGRNDIGIRIPDSKIIMMLLKILKKPIVIPSANIHNKPSPTTAQQVLKDLDGQVDLIIDGGETKYGIESTVVLCINEKIKILRVGAISKREIFSSLSKQD